MGCDIHGWVEKKVRGNWIGIRPLTDHKKARERNYHRFAALAGVRGEGPQPRGLPLDASDSAAYDAECWDGDGHSHSWLPLAEAVPIFVECRYQGEERSDFAKKYPASYFFDVEEEDLSDYRIVFWFDN
jgi:hypothetical protein